MTCCCTDACHCFLWDDMLLHWCLSLSGFGMTCCYIDDCHCLLRDNMLLCSRLSLSAVGWHVAALTLVTVRFVMTCCYTDGCHCPLQHDILLHWCFSDSTHTAEFAEKENERSKYIEYTLMLESSSCVWNIFDRLVNSDFLELSILLAKRNLFAKTFSFKPCSQRIFVWSDIE